MAERDRVGLIIGKFDPPHRGHSLLIDVARGYVNHLIVFVRGMSEQTIAAQTRVAWLRQLHPDVDVRLIADLVPSDDAQSWADYTIGLLGHAPEIVFSSNAFMQQVAQALGSRHFAVDRERQWVPVTSGMIQECPLAMLEWLDPCVRAHYVKRVCIGGSESTGKTSLAAYLARRYETNWVAEYGREYTVVRHHQGLSGHWITDEFYHIAREQQRREDEAAHTARKVLFCDTDAIATRIWHERYLGTEPPNWPLPPSKIALYLVPYPDTPFVQDDIRDSEHMRFWMYERFIAELSRLEIPHLVLHGTYAEREEQAARAVDEMLAEALTTQR